MFQILALSLQPKNKQIYDFSTHLYYSRTRRASFGQQSDVRWLRV